MPENTNKIPIIYDWSVPVIWTDWSTSFHIYDEDTLFQTASVSVAQQIVTLLGFPVVDVLLTPTHIFTAHLQAVSKYVGIVNLYKIKNNMLDMYGTKVNGVDLTTAGIANNLNGIYKIALMYGQLQIILNSPYIQIYSASVDVVSGTQLYLLDDYIGTHSGKLIQLIRVYHHANLYNGGYYDPLVYPGFNMSAMNSLFGGSIGINARHVLMPLFETALKMQSVGMNAEMRHPHNGFSLNKGKLRLYPPPNLPFLLRIDYILKLLKYLNAIMQDAINNISNFPINEHIQYSNINVPGRNWINRYTMAASKLILGIIRSKYDSIPYTLGDVSMDGLSLKSLGRLLMLGLVELLKLILLLSSKYYLMLKQALMALNVNKILKFTPQRIYIG